MRQLTVSFQPPEQPNGYILLYEMEYFPVDRNSCELFEVLFQQLLLFGTKSFCSLCVCITVFLSACLPASHVICLCVVCLRLPLSVHLLSTVFFACVHTLSTQLNYTVV